MGNIKYKLLNTAFGALSGLTGLFSMTRCAGGHCISCFGCAGTGIGLLLIALFNKFKRGKPSD